MKAIFEYRMKVRDYECDAQGHVNNANYQHYFGHPPRVPGAGGAKLLPAAPGVHRRGGTGRHTVQDTPYRHGRVPLHRYPDRATERVIFHQEIIRLKDNALCAKAKIEVVNLVNGKLSKPEVFDEAFKDYI